LAPANRVDLLVEAPAAPGCYTLKSGKTTLVYVTVTGDPVSMGFPTHQDDFPKQLDFLGTIDPATIHLRREPTLGASQDPQNPGQSCPSKVVDDGKDKWCSGYFKMRSRFADFTGQYVQHCHLLAHEDRGMMQLLEVVTDKTVLKHH